MIEKIKENAKLYRRSVFKRNGAIVIDHDQTKNKCFQSEWLSSLSNESLQEVGYILMHMSRNNGMNAVIENDHIEYFSHVNCLILKSSIDSWIKKHNPLYSFVDFQLINKLKPRFRDEVNKKCQNELLDNVLYHDFFPTSWSGFAYLEGVCRRICKKYITTNGVVIKTFVAQEQRYRSAIGNKLAKKGNKGRKEIYNLEHLLELTIRQVSKKTKQILKKYFSDYSANMIFTWRNDSLHGSEDRSTTIIVLYCLIGILLIDLLSKE